MKTLHRMTNIGFALYSLVYLGAAAIAAPVNAQTKDMPGGEDLNYYQYLYQFPFYESDAALKRFEEERNARIAELVRILQSNEVSRDPLGPQTRAIQFLGRYRAAEAVPVLMEKLTFLPDYDPRVNLSPHLSKHWSYPAVRALIAINTPDLPERLRSRILLSIDVMERENAALVLIEIMGRSRAAAYLYEATQFHRPESGDRLSSVLAVLPELGRSTLKVPRSFLHQPSSDKTGVKTQE